MVAGGGVPELREAVALREKYRMPAERGPGRQRAGPGRAEPGQRARLAVRGAAVGGQAGCA